MKNYFFLGMELFSLAVVGGWISILAFDYVEFCRYVVKLIENFSLGGVWGVYLLEVIFVLLMFTVVGFLIKKILHFFVKNYNKLEE